MLNLTKMKTFVNRLARTEEDLRHGDAARDDTTEVWMDEGGINVGRPAAIRPAEASSRRRTEVIK